MEGIYVIRLTITNERNVSAFDDVTITVTKNISQTALVTTLTSFTPTSGIAGSNVTITGTNFGTAPAVSFNGTPAVVLSSSPTTISTTVPATATSGNITVTVNGTAVKSSTAYTIQLPTLAEYYFQGNMDNVTITQGSSGLLFNGWNELKNNAYISDIYLNNLGGSAYAFQEIRTDPVNPSIKALYAQTIDNDPNSIATTRAQMTIGFNNGTNLSVYHTSHRMYLNPDIGYLTNYSSSITWFTLFEIWNKRVSEWSGDQAGSARWSFSVKKLSGSGQPLYWTMDSQLMQPEAVKYNHLWNYSNKTVPIPLGKWFTLDFYMKRGEGTNGRVIIKITPDGGATSTLFDISNTTIYPGRPDIQLSSWQPFKLYLDDTYLDWMRANNKTLSIFYNDFKWHKN